MLLLFGFYNYYPGGGMNDLVGKFNSEDEIEEWFKNCENSTTGRDYYQVYDTEKDIDYSYYPPEIEDEED